MKCDQCGKKIGNTLYEVGEKKLCPICHLGEEGLQEKYQKFDSCWTEPGLAAFKNPPFKEKMEDSAKYWFDFKNGVWKLKAL